MQNELRAWTVNDSIELYNIGGWGVDFFSINEAGNVSVTPAGPGATTIDLKELVDDLCSRGLNLPILIRFSDILRTRLEQLFGAFQQAIVENEYRGAFRGVYPVKVNQQRHVVEDLMEYGRPFNLGIEVGSKPRPGSPGVCRGTRRALILPRGRRRCGMCDRLLMFHRPPALTLPAVPLPAKTKFAMRDAAARCPVHPSPSPGPGKATEPAASTLLEQLDALLGAQLRAARKLRAALAAEYAALERRDAPAVATSCRDRDGVIEDMTRLERDRRALCLRLGAGPGWPELAAWLEAFSDGGALSSRLAGRRAEIVILLRECQTARGANGTLAAMLQRRVEQAEGLLRGRRGGSAPGHDAGIDAGMAPEAAYGVPT